MEGGDDPRLRASKIDQVSQWAGLGGDDELAREWLGAADRLSATRKVCWPSGADLDHEEFHREQNMGTKA